MKCYRDLEFRIQLEENGFWTCFNTEASPVLGMGHSPLEALESYVKAIPECAELWSKKLTLSHAEESESALHNLNFLKWITQGYKNAEVSAIYTYPEGEQYIYIDEEEEEK